MRIVLLCGDQSNQHALAHRISEQFELAGIVLESKAPQRKKQWSSLPVKVLDRLLFSSIRSSWMNMLDHYRHKYPGLPGNARILRVEKINSSETLDLIADLKPDLLMVSGTTMIRQKILDLEIPKGIINLHTGLSPYVKGAPNCTNWCIANRTFHLIGNTVMWIDKGIDSGNIISTETTTLSGNETLNELHIAVMEHAHDLYLRCVKQIEKNTAACPSVKQSDIGKGELFLNRHWNFRAKTKFLWSLSGGHFKKSLAAPDHHEKQKKLVLISLPS